MSTSKQELDQLKFNHFHVSRILFMSTSKQELDQLKFNTTYKHNINPIIYVIFVGLS